MQSGPPPHKCDSYHSAGRDRWSFKGIANRYRKEMLGCITVIEGMSHVGVLSAERGKNQGVQEKAGGKVLGCEFVLRAIKTGGANWDRTRSITPWRGSAHLHGC